MPAEGHLVAVIDAHEDRIQRLEEGAQEVAKGLATNTAEISALGDKMELSAKLIVQEMKSCVAPLAERLRQHIDQDEVTNERTSIALEGLNSNHDKLMKLEGREAERSRRSHWYQKLIIPVVVAALTSLIHIFLHSHGR